MLVEQLKSKIHRAMITRGDVQYEGSIEIPADLMAAVDLWPGEKVLVASVTSGNRLETYCLKIHLRISDINRMRQSVSPD